jgi:hypothetical protein
MVLAGNGPYHGLKTESAFAMLDHAQSSASLRSPVHGRDIALRPLPPAVPHPP